MNQYQSVISQTALSSDMSVSSFRITVLTIAKKKFFSNIIMLSLWNCYVFISYPRKLQTPSIHIQWNCDFEMALKARNVQEWIRGRVICGNYRIFLLNLQWTFIACWWFVDVQAKKQRIPWKRKIRNTLYVFFKLVIYWHSQYRDCGSDVRKIKEWGAVGEMRIGSGNWSTLRKSAPMPLCPPQTPHDVTWEDWHVNSNDRRVTKWVTNGYKT
jgi:hypothetical protein